MEDKSNPRTEKDTRSIESRGHDLSSHSLLEFEIRKFKKNLKSNQSNLKQNDRNLFLNQIKNESGFIADIDLPLKDLVKTLDKIKRTSSLKELLTTLHSSNIFKGINKVQYLIHRLGSTSCESISVDDSGAHSKKVPIDKFNSLFTAVLKSKTKLFDQGHFLSDIIETNGYFIAESLRLKGSNLIILLSNNSFLPPEVIEFRKLHFISKIMQENFEAHIFKDSMANRKLLAHELINNLSLKISIDKDSTEEIFKQEIDGHIITIQNSNSDSATTIYHHERISLLGELLNTLQHELSNPLFGLNLSTSMLLMEEFNEDAISTIKDISSSIKRCEVIIKNFSHLYKDETTNSKFNLISLIKETLVLAKSESKHILKNLIFDDKLADLEIVSNPTWLSQILFNLVINSSQALNASSIEKKRIDIEVLEVDDAIEIFIKDNGPGIGPDLAKEIFKPFYTTKKTGTGLGLAICQNLAKKLGSKLELTDSSNGACFKLSIPNEKNSTH